MQHLRKKTRGGGVAAGRACLMARWDPYLLHVCPCSRHHPCSGADKSRSLVFLCNLQHFLHPHLGCSTSGREIIKVMELIAMARCHPVTEGNGKAALVWPERGSFLTTPAAQLTLGGYSKIVLSCTRLRADPVWLQARWCCEATVTTLPWMHSPKGFDTLKKIQRKKKRGEEGRGFQDAWLCPMLPS